MSRLSQMLVVEQNRRGQTERALAEEYGWSQQTFNTWKKGAIPRPVMFARLASFLNISTDMVRELAEEAAESTGNTKLPKMSVFDRTSTEGKVVDRKDGRFKFSRPLPAGRYAVSVDTKIMEPALLAGKKAWLDPGVWPAVGNEVIVHAKGGLAWIGRLNDLSAAVVLERADGLLTVKDVEAVHVIVLSERV